MSGPTFSQRVQRLATVASHCHAIRCAVRDHTRRLSIIIRPMPPSSARLSFCTVVSLFSCRERQFAGNVRSLARRHLASSVHFLYFVNRFVVAIPSRQMGVEHAGVESKLCQIMPLLHTAAGCYRSFVGMVRLVRIFHCKTVATWIRTGQGRCCTKDMSVQPS